MLNHREGQYKAELFEELIGYLLHAKFRESRIARNVLVPTRVRGGAAFVADYFVVLPNDDSILVEVKAPYSSEVEFGIERTIRKLKSVAGWLSRPDGYLRTKRIVLAVGATLPERLLRSLQQTHLGHFRNSQIEFEIWDFSRIGTELLSFFHQRPSSMSIAALEQVVTALRAGWPNFAVGETNRSLWLTGTEPVPPTISDGEREGVIVLCADFCSYSKFVQASGGNQELISSVMGRFYRHCRGAIEACGGVLDKFIGDGILAYWLTDGVRANAIASRVDRCVYSLAGIAMSVAENWQDQIDQVVKPTGMRFGAAIGSVLFISENGDGKQPIHAIGDCINKAARLQAGAQPNTILIANTLKKELFNSYPGFTEEPKPLKAKNIGELKVWKKEYETETPFSGGDPAAGT